MANTFRALIVRTLRPIPDTHLHLIRDGAASSLCDIPRESLTTSGIFDEVVCAACMFAISRGIEFHYPKTPD